MRAERDDIPYHVQKRRKKPRLAIALILLSPLFTFAALFLPQSPFYQGFTPQQAVNNVKALVNQKTNPLPTPPPGIVYVRPEDINWVNSKAKTKEEFLQEMLLKEQLEKQRSRPINIIPAEPITIQRGQPTQHPAQNTRNVVVRQTKPSDVCKEVYRVGSIEHRECVFSKELNARNSGWKSETQATAIR